MPIILHAVIAASYSLLAAAAILLLPVFAPLLPQLAIWMIAPAVFVVGAMFHVILTLTERSRRTTDQVLSMRRHTQRLADDVVEAQAQSLQLRQSVEQAGKAGEQRVSQVVAEVKVLQGLIEAFSKRQIEEAQTVAGVGGTAPHLVVVGGDQPAARPPMPPISENVEDQEIVRVLHEALRLERVDVYLQPIVSLPQRKTRYYECFTRIRDEDGTVLGPARYIEIAEREGLVNAIDNLLLFRCVQLIRRTQQRNYDIAFFCNVSSHSLADTRFISDFVDFVSQNEGLAPNLYFEFSQADLENAPMESLQNLSRLAELGFRFSLDQVQHLDIDFPGLSARNFRFIKIAANLLLEPLHEADNDIAAADLKERFNRFGLDLIVEKIESEPELVELLDFNIDFGQGYLFGEPRLSRTD